MKVSCSQCGAEHTVLESEFYLRCPYCDATILVNPPESIPVLVAPGVTSEEASRLFPSGSVSSVELRYFPYLEGEEGKGLRPCFSQPWSELDGYAPPAGDRRIFDRSLTDPEQLIPFDREMEETGGKIVYHPFLILMLRLEGYAEGVLVDGVSGRLLGESPLAEPQQGSVMTYTGLFLRVLAGALAASIPVYLIMKLLGADGPLSFLVSLLLAAPAGILVMNRLEREGGVE